MGDQSLSIPLPETYEAIELACMRGMKESLHRIESSVYKLPEAIFKSSAVVTKSSSNVSSSVPKVPPVPSFLHEVTSHRFNLIERICHRLLDIDPDMFSSKPTNDSTRSYFSSGSVFRNLCNVHKDARAVPLCISISLDSATVNSARNRSECPVLFSILNVNEAATYQLIGYCPILLPYTDQVLAEKLAAYSGDLSRLVMQYLKRQMKRQYLNDILEPLLSLGTSGFVAQVGTGSKAQRYNFIPYLCMIVGDSEELGSKITGTSEKTGCRCCTTKHVEEYDPNKLAIHELRNDKDMDDVKPVKENNYFWNDWSIIVNMERTSPLGSKTTHGVRMLMQHCGVLDCTQGLILSTNTLNFNRSTVSIAITEPSFLIICTRFSSD